MIDTPIDYKEVKRLLASEQMKSMDYLKKITSVKNFSHNK